VPADRLLEEAHVLAHRFIDGRSPVAVALTRQMLWRNASESHPLEAHCIDSLMVHALSQRDGREGVRAFQEKRAPCFTATVSADMPAVYPWWKR
jgi:enoyl-CoA hydratase/carnithine racemase